MISGKQPSTPKPNDDALRLWFSESPTLAPETIVAKITRSTQYSSYNLSYFEQKPTLVALI